MSKIKSFITENWLEISIGLILAVSPVLRFSWDLWAQAGLHCAVLAAAALFFIFYRPAISSFAIVSCIFFACACLTIIISSNRAATRNELMVLFDALMCAYMFSQLAVDKKRSLLLIPCMAGIWLSVILFYYFIRNPLAYFNASELQIDPLVNLNVIAGYLLLAAGASLCFVNKAKISTLIIPAILLAGLILTQSRGALLIGCAQLLIFAIIKRAISIKMLLYCFSIVAGFLIFFTFNKIRSGHDIIFSITDRIEWWHTAFNAFLANPAMGVGWGNFSGISSTYRSIQGLNSLYCHNVFLQIAAETGLIGIFSALIFIVVVYKRAILSMPVLLGISAFLAHNLFDFNFYVPAVMILFFIFCAYPFDNFPLKRKSGYFASSVIIISAALLIFYAIQPFMASQNYQHAIYLINTGNLKEADRYLANSQQIDPLNPQTPAKRAELAFGEYTTSKNISRLDSAIEFQKTAVRLFSTNAALWADLSWLLSVKGDIPQARSTLLRAVALDRYNEKYKKSYNLLTTGNPESSL